MLNLVYKIDRVPRDPPFGNVFQYLILNLVCKIDRVPNGLVTANHDGFLGYLSVHVR